MTLLALNETSRFVKKYGFLSMHFPLDSPFFGFNKVRTQKEVDCIF